MNKKLFFGIALFFIILTAGSQASAYYYYAQPSDSYYRLRPAEYISPYTQTMIYEETEPAEEPELFFGIIQVVLNGVEIENQSVIYDIEEGDEMLFTPEKNMLTQYPELTWKWHYDSRGLHCNLTANNNLECLVVNARLGSDVWAEFIVPGENKTRASNKIAINRPLENVRAMPNIIEEEEIYIPEVRLAPYTYRSYYDRKYIPTVRPTNYYNFWRYPYYSRYYDTDYRSRFPRYYQYWYE